MSWFPNSVQNHHKDYLRQTVRLVIVRRLKSNGEVEELWLVTDRLELDRRLGRLGLPLSLGDRTLLSLVQVHSRLSALAVQGRQRRRLAGLCSTDR